MRRRYKLLRSRRTCCTEVYHAEAVFAVIVISAVVTEPGCLAVVVQELHRISVTYFSDQISFVPDILNSAVADRLTGSQPIGAVWYIRNFNNSKMDKHYHDKFDSLRDGL